jgi:prolyl oligopeptidase PreP (S9A serine peptidase family)
MKQLNKPQKWSNDEKNGGIGSWEDELGNSEISEEECRKLLAISPLHNVRAYWVRDDELCYPAILLQTSHTNSNVNSIHSYKYAAHLQRIWGSNDRADNPILLAAGEQSSAYYHDSTSQALSFLATYIHADYMV